MKEYDLIILGGGAAGFAAANTANRLKKRTLMINDEKTLPLGGTCVNVGCVPSKIMLHQGAVAYYPQGTAFRAIKVSGQADFVKALEETREMALGFKEQNYGKVIKNQEYIDFVEGHGKFTDPRTIAVNEKKFRGEKIIITTGASTFIPPVKGIEDVNYLTNKSVFFELDEKPESIIILGGGAMGLEFSQIFHHFGIKVTIIELAERLLTKFDELLAKDLESHLKEEGITIHTGSNIIEVIKTNKGVKVIYRKEDSSEMSVEADKIMVSTGLNSNTGKIGIEDSGVELDKKGNIKVNDYLQTTEEHIYAAGDVTGLMPLETVAAKQGSNAAKNMFEDAGLIINYDEIPAAVFTAPEVAAVGITEAEYMKKYDRCLCRTISWEHVEKAAAIKETKGIIRMVIDPDTKVVLGVHIVGNMAADIITTATYAIKNKMTIYDIRDTVHVFPTLSEVIKKAAQSFDQDLNEMACCVE